MAEALNLDVDEQDGIGVLTVSGYINNAGGEQISAVCERLMEAGGRRFVLDLSGCRIVNSVGISILIEIIEKLKEIDGRLAFCSLTPTIAKTFRIMGLLQTCTLHDDRQAAVMALSK